MPPVGFEPTISASERPQTYALDRAATGTGMCHDLDEFNRSRPNVQKLYQHSLYRNVFLSLYLSIFVSVPA